MYIITRVEHKMLSLKTIRDTIQNEPNIKLNSWFIYLTSRWKIKLPFTWTNGGEIF